MLSFCYYPIYLLLKYPIIIKMHVIYKDHIDWGVLNQENISEVRDDTTVRFKPPIKEIVEPIQPEVPKTNRFMKFINRIRNYISPRKKPTINIKNRQFIDELSLHTGTRPQKPNILVSRGSIIKSLSQHFGMPPSSITRDGGEIDSMGSPIDPYKRRVNPAIAWH
jgi:hypothetical protein